jgi:hypothetical protein
MPAPGGPGTPHQWIAVTQPAPGDESVRHRQRYDLAQQQGSNDHPPARRSSIHSARFNHSLRRCDDRGCSTAKRRDAAAKRRGAGCCWCAATRSARIGVMGTMRPLGRSRFWRLSWFLALAVLCEWRLPAHSRTLSTPARSSFRPIQFNPVEDLAAGKFLVASRRLGHPNFSQSVVLLVHYSSRAAAEVIINRPTKLPLSRAL